MPTKVKTIFLRDISCSNECEGERRRRQAPHVNSACTRACLRCVHASACALAPAQTHSIQRVEVPAGGAPALCSATHMHARTWRCRYSALYLHVHICICMYGVCVCFVRVRVSAVRVCDFRRTRHFYSLWSPLFRMLYHIRERERERDRTHSHTRKHHTHKLHFVVRGV